MIGEREPLQDIDGPGKLDRAKEAVQAAAQMVSVINGLTETLMNMMVVS